MIEKDDLELLKKVIAKAERGEAPLPSALKKALTEYVSPQKEKVKRTRKKKLIVGKERTPTRKKSRPHQTRTQKKQRGINTNKTRKIKIKC